MALQIEMCVVSVFLALLSAIRASCSDGVGTLQPACFNASCWIRVIVTANALDAMSSKGTVATFVSLSSKVEGSS